METYSRIGLLRSYRNFTVVLDYYEAIETYSRIFVDHAEDHDHENDDDNPEETDSQVQAEYR